MRHIGAAAALAGRSAKKTVTRLSAGTYLGRGSKVAVPTGIAADFAGASPRPAYVRAAVVMAAG